MKELSRKQKLALNSISSLVYQVTAIVSGFILPRFFLAYYGSTVNGLVSSITQFLGFISLAECGVGAVVQSALYKPLAEHDMLSVSKIVVSAERFFRKIAYLLLVYVFILVVFYPIITIEKFDYFSTATLIVVISISTFAQYYLGMSYRLLLLADQLGFIQYIIHTISLVLNTAACVALMYFGTSIQVVKLVTSLIFLAQPVCLSVIARRKYSIDRKVSYTEEPIQQKWNGLAQHIASVILGNTDVVVLTLFSTLENVSIYSVYYLVVNGVKQIVVSLTNGTQALLGNMLARNEKETLELTFSSIEFFIHSFVTCIFSITAVLIVSFVTVYTQNIHDVDYSAPTFAYILVLAQAIYCVRLPYNTIVLAAGHYKQTQWSAILEAIINVVFSVASVKQFGLIGVAVGTFLAMSYRTVFLACYLRKNILHRKLRHFVKHVLVDAAIVILIFIVVMVFSEYYTISSVDYFAWVCLAIKVSVTAIVICVLVNLMIYRAEMRRLLSRISKKMGNLKCNI